MANPAVSDPQSPFNVSPEMTRGQEIREQFTLTGSTSGVGTTATLTCKWIKNVTAVLGPVSWTAVGGVVTATVITDLVSAVVSVEVVGTNV